MCSPSTCARNGLKFKSFAVSLITLFTILGVTGCSPSNIGDSSAIEFVDLFTTELPTPTIDGNVSLEGTIHDRRSQRNFSDESLTLQELSQLLWAANGITDESGRRSAPSAGGLYPLSVYVVAGNVEGLPAGLYRFVPDGHKLAKVVEGDFRQLFAEAANNQGMIADAPASILYAADFGVSEPRYGVERAQKYVYIEVGHSAQNVYLQSVALGLGTVAVGTVDESRTRRALAFPENESLVYLMPLGAIAD